MNNWQKIHSQFKLNNHSFDDIYTFLSFLAQNLPSKYHTFLKDWFSDKPFLAVESSGSTGKPKTIVLKKEYVLNSIQTTANYFQLYENTKALLCLPIEYIAGKLMLLRAISLGWHLDVIEPSSEPLQNINKIYDFAAMVPLQVQNSIQKMHLIHKLLIGGAAINQTLESKLKDLKTNIFLSYGMTETITHIAIKKVNHTELKPNYFEVLPNVNIWVDDRNCLVIDAKILSDTLIFTNDVVQLISDTQFELLGRFDNVINSGGIKIHPEIIEQKIASKIKCRFFVTSLPDEKLGEKVILVLESKPFTIDFNDFEFTFFEKPKQVFFTQKFIETTSGKIKRKETLAIILNSQQVNNQ